MSLRRRLLRAAVRLMAEALRRMLLRYCETRGIPVPDDSGVGYLGGEVRELEEAIDADDREATVHEIADVALALAAVAMTHGLTSESCIRAKTAHDAGRGRKRMEIME